MVPVSPAPPSQEGAGREEEESDNSEDDEDKSYEPSRDASAQEDSDDESEDAGHSSSDAEDDAEIVAGSPVCGGYLRESYNVSYAQESDSDDDIPLLLAQHVPRRSERRYWEHGHASDQQADVRFNLPSPSPFHAEPCVLVCGLHMPIPHLAY